MQIKGRAHLEASDAPSPQVPQLNFTVQTSIFQPNATLDPREGFVKTRIGFRSKSEYGKKAGELGEP